MARAQLKSTPITAYLTQQRTPVEQTLSLRNPRRVQAWFSQFIPWEYHGHGAGVLDVQYCRLSFSR